MPMPTGMICFAETVVGHLKTGSTRRIHRQWHGLDVGGQRAFKMPKLRTKLRLKAPGYATFQVFVTGLTQLQSVETIAPGDAGNIIPLRSMINLKTGKPKRPQALSAHGEGNVREKLSLDRNSF